MRCNLPEQIVVHIVRLSAGDYSQQEVAGLFGVKHRMCQQKFAMHLGHWSATTSAAAWRSGESHHSPKIQTVDPNGKGQLFYIGFSSMRGDDPQILMEVISSDDCKQAYGCWLSVKPSPQMSQVDFRSQGMPPCVRENSQKVGPEAQDALWLQSWVSLNTVSQRWSCSCAPQARGETDKSVHPIHRR